jgi:hypothetical protein
VGDVLDTRGASTREVPRKMTKRDERVSLVERTGAALVPHPSLLKALTRSTLRG